MVSEASPDMIPLVPVPHAYRSLDWERLVREYPPPPDFFTSTYIASPEQVRQLQEDRLGACLAHAWNRPFYRKRWQAAGIEPGDIKTVDDLHKLPTYVVEDIRQSIDSAPPFGEYQGLTFADAQKQPMRIFTSGGTTGRPRPTLYSYWDRNVGAILRARAFYLTGFRPGDPVQNTLLYSTHNGAFIVDESLFNWLGCIPVTTSAGIVTRSTRQIELMRDWGVAGLVGFRDFLIHLAETAKSMGIDPVKDLKLRNISTMGGDQRGVEAAWGGINAQEVYGMHEVQVVAAECPAKNGMHLWLDAFVVDIVDIDTGEPVKEGEIGSIVLTCLYKTGVPVVRYDTKDTTRLLSRDRCACGSRLPRIDNILGRADTMVKLRGINVWPEACGEVARRDGRLNGEYFCFAERRNGRDEMMIMVERRSQSDSEDEDIRKQLEERLRSTLSVAIGVDVRGPGGLVEFTRFGIESKPRRFEDRRPKS